MSFFSLTNCDNITVTYSSSISISRLRSLFPGGDQGICLKSTRTQCMHVFSSSHIQQIDSDNSLWITFTDLAGDFIKSNLEMRTNTSNIMKESEQSQF